MGLEKLEARERVACVGRCVTLDAIAGELVQLAEDVASKGRGEAADGQRDAAREALGRSKGLLHAATIIRRWSDR